VAETITVSGDAVELAQTVTDPAERRARDETLRAVFADPTSRHHEVIAEAELDVDYRGSPIVMGDEHDALAPGQRLPDTIEVILAGGEVCMLHQLTQPRRPYRAAHRWIIGAGRKPRPARQFQTGPERHVPDRSDHCAHGALRRSEFVRTACVSRSRPAGHRRGYASCHPARRTCTSEPTATTSRF
jgi:hypothetical protein